MIIYLNGRFVPRDDAGIDPLERGVLLGEGVFETMRAESGQLLHSSAHHARMAQGADFLGLAFHMSAPMFRDVCQHVIDANSLQNARVRATLLAPAVDAFSRDAENAPPTLVIHAVPLADAKVIESLAKPWRLRVASFAINHESLVRGIKSTSYLENVLARRQAVTHGADEALFRNSAGRFAEGAMTNFFVVDREGALLTPAVQEGALPGIMRGEVLGLAARLGIGVREGEVRDADIASASELFMTNAIQQIVPVSRVEGVWDGGAAGPVTSALFAAYRSEVQEYLSAIRRG